MALSPPPSNLDTLFGCPRALGWGPLLLQICLHMVGGGRLDSAPGVLVTSRSPRFLVLPSQRRPARRA